MVGVTRAPYNYAGDNPLNYADRSGLGEGEIELPCAWPFCAPPPPVTEGIEGIVKGGQEGAEGVAHGAENIWNEITGGGDSTGELPRVDGTGRAHGSIPTHPPGDMTQKELEEAKEELDESIARRKEEQLQGGEDPAHRRRINEEERLRRQIEKKLGC
jgi:hypothetical protein